MAKKKTAAQIKDENFRAAMSKWNPANITKPVFTPTVYPKTTAQTMQKWTKAPVAPPVLTPLQKFGSGIAKGVNNFFEPAKPVPTGEVNKGQGLFAQNLIPNAQKLTLQNLAKNKTNSNLKNIALMPLGLIGSIDEYLNTTNKTAARTSAVAHNAMLGDTIPIPETGSRIKNMVADNLGFLLGLGAPLSGGSSINAAISKAGAPVEKLAMKGLAKVGVNKGLAKVATSAAKGYSEFGALGAMQSAQRGDDLKTTLKNINDLGKQGALLGGVFKTAGLATKIPASIRDLNFAAIDTKLGKLPPMNIPRNLGKGTGKLTVPVPVEAVIKVPYKGTYTIKNTVGQAAQKEYDNAIELIQNHFGTNKLTPAEVARIEPELGINVEKLASKLNDKTDVRQIAERNWLMRVADVKNTAFEPTTTKTIEQIPYSKVMRGAKTEAISSVMTQRTKIPASTELVQGTEMLPMVSTQKTQIGKAPAAKRFLTSPLKQEVITPMEGTKTRATTPTGAIASGESKTIVDRASIFSKSGKLNNTQKIEHDLLALKGGETYPVDVLNNLDFQTPRANVSGFDLQQRSQIADELINGIKKNEDVIKIKVFHDGELDIQNNPSNIADIMNTLKIKNKRSFEPKFGAATQTSLQPKTPEIQPLNIGRTGEKYINTETAGTRTQPLTQRVGTPATSSTSPIWNGTEIRPLEGRATRNIRSSGYRQGVEIPITNVSQYRTARPLRGATERPLPAQLQRPAQAPAGLAPEVQAANLSPELQAQIQKAAIEQPALQGLNAQQTIPEATASPETVNPSIGAMGRTQSEQQVITGELPKIKGAQKFKNLFEAYKKHITDVNAPFQKLGEKTFIKATNVNKIGSTVNNILTKDLVDMNGKVIGEGLANIAKDIPVQDEQKFFQYILQKHNVDRATQDKSIFTDFNAQQSKNAVMNLEALNPEFKDVGDRLVKFLNTLESEWGNKSGLVSDDLWKALQELNPSYIPTQRGFSRIEKGVSGVSKAGRSLVDTGNALKKASGSARNVINPIENIMNLVNTTVRTARHNEIGQSMLQALRENPKLKEYAEIVPAGKKINANVNNVVTVLEKGEPVHIRFKENGMSILEALKGIQKMTDNNIFTKSVKTANNIFKSLITTNNPLFAIKNILRDIPTAYIQGSEHNPIKHLGNVAKAYWELADIPALKKSPSAAAKQYKALGGEMANFLTPEHLAQNAEQLMGRKLKTEVFNGENIITGSKKISKLVKSGKAIIDATEKFNNLTESAPRFAEFKKVLEQTGDIQKALYKSGEVTTNFARGGDLTKALDSYVPYLNASVQGLSKFGRTLNPRHPTKALGAAIKAGLAITAPTAFFDYINKDNPNYKALDNRTKDNYFLIPNGDTFIKIPKAREYGVIFSTLFQRASRLMDESTKDGAAKGLVSTALTNFAPNNPINSNLAAPFLYLMANKDFASRTIVPASMTSDQRSDYLQFDEKTTELAKWFGKAVKDLPIGSDFKSPEKIDYLIRSYLGVISQLGTPLITKTTQAGATSFGQKLGRAAGTTFKADSLYNNQAVTDFFDNKNKYARKAADTNLLNNIPSNTNTVEEQNSKIFYKANGLMSEITKKINIANALNNQEEVKKLRKEYIQVAEKANERAKEFK